jgi:hypothetical protein
MKRVSWIFLLISCLSTFSLNASAEYQCFVKDRGGHMWASEGSTEDRAKAVAMSFCSAYSPNSASCSFNRCISH